MNKCYKSEWQWAILTLSYKISIFFQMIFQHFSSQSCFSWFRPGVSNSNSKKIEPAGRIKRKKSLCGPQKRIKSALIPHKIVISCDFLFGRGSQNHIRWIACLIPLILPLVVFESLRFAPLNQFCTHFLKS